MCIRDSLHDVKPIQGQCFITMPNGKQAQIQHIGSMELVSGLILTEVLHIPDFHFNLLSVSKLTKQYSANVIFTPNVCLLQGHTLGKDLILGRKHVGLYCLEKGTRLQVSQTNVSQQVPSAKGIFSANLSVSELWHFRLGHLSFEQMLYVHLPDCNNFTTHGVCQICPMAKLHRQSFPLSTSRALNCFNLLHVDIWGPYSHRTYNGSRFFLTIVDDHSRATWVHLLAHKSNAFPLLKAFVSFVETQFGAIVQVIRSDNGMEFKDDSALTFLQRKRYSSSNNLSRYSSTKWDC